MQKNLKTKKKKKGSVRGLPEMGEGKKEKGMIDMEEIRGKGD